MSRTLGLERLCRYGSRGPIAECRLRKLSDELYEYTPKRGVTFTLTAKDLVSRLVALAPPAKSHLTSFHGLYAPHAKRRAPEFVTIDSRDLGFGCGSRSRHSMIKRAVAICGGAFVLRISPSQNERPLTCNRLQ